MRFLSASSFVIAFCLLCPACLALSTPVGTESLRHPSYAQAATHILTKSNVLTVRRLDVCTDVSNLHCRIRVDVPEPFGWRDDIDVVTEVRFLGLCEEVVENRDAPDLMQRKFGWPVAILRIRRWPDSCPCHGDVLDIVISAKSSSLRSFTVVERIPR